MQTAIKSAATKKPSSVERKLAEVMKRAPMSEAEIRAAVDEYARGYNPDDEQSIRDFLARPFVTHSLAEMRGKLTVRRAAKALLPRRGRGLQKAPTKRLVSMRLDAEVIEAFRATGAGWQSRLNEQLRTAVKRMRRAAK
jgi:uncharacterized protein (DUF4415 family)